MTKANKKLDEVYKKIPHLECKGLCHASCTVIPVGGDEEKRAVKKLGFNPFGSPEKAMKALKEGKEVPPCGALKNNRCSIYEIRPLICRLFGVAEGISCPFGCAPKKDDNKRKSAYFNGQSH